MKREEELWVEIEDRNSLYLRLCNIHVPPRNHASSAQSSGFTDGVDQVQLWAKKKNRELKGKSAFMLTSFLL